MMPSQSLQHARSGERRPQTGRIAGPATNRQDSPGASCALAAAGTVHDLGNLIQIATSAVDIVARTPDMAPDRARAVFARARMSLDQAGALVRQTIGVILDRSGGEERSTIAACLADVMALVDGIGQSRFTLAVDIEPDLPQVRCHPLGLRNAILNLVLNARDAMAGRGEVLIEAQAVWGGVNMVELRVMDEGIGMSPETVRRAFDPFFTTKSDGLGGVGLPMVERFVLEAGGEIEVDSEPGAGTTVTLRLPIVDPDPPAALFTGHAEQEDGQ